MSKRPSDEDALKRLERELEAAEARTRRKPKRYGDEVASGGYRLVAELLSGILAGLGLGWLLDRWAGTAPWGIIVGVLLGTAVSIFLVVKSAGRMSARAAKEHGPAPAVPFDDEDSEDERR